MNWNKVQINVKYYHLLEQLENNRNKVQQLHIEGNL